MHIRVQFSVILLVSAFAIGAQAQSTGNYQFTTASSDTTASNINPCASNPCFNGGYCIPTDKSFACICPIQFTGRLCNQYQTAVQTTMKSIETTATASSPCALNPCYNGGSCMPFGNQAQCICPLPFTGRFCNEVRPTAQMTTKVFATTADLATCALYPCFNGGSCVVSNRQAQCICQPPFKGRFCHEI